MRAVFGQSSCRTCLAKQALACANNTVPYLPVCEGTLRAGLGLVQAIASSLRRASSSARKLAGGETSVASLDDAR
eukprot:4441205-Alexandrium_andersonii.AAC.1